MKKILCVAFAAIVSVAAIFAVDPKYEKMVQNFINHGNYIKEVYLNGEILYRCGNPKTFGFWITANDKKFEYRYGGWSNHFQFDRWDISADEDGNLIFTEKEGTATKPKK